MYVIADPCVGSKQQACVGVCPVDCIHPTPEEAGFDAAQQLYIDPLECIDCGACESQCPVQAIFRDAELPQEWTGSKDLNAAFFNRPAER